MWKNVHPVSGTGIRTHDLKDRQIVTSLGPQVNVKGCCLSGIIFLMNLNIWFTLLFNLIHTVVQCTTVNLLLFVCSEIVESILQWYFPLRSKWVCTLLFKAQLYKNWNGIFFGPKSFVEKNSLSLYLCSKKSFKWTLKLFCKYQKTNPKIMNVFILHRSSLQVGLKIPQVAC